MGDEISNKVEMLRIRYKYRSLIMKRKVELPVTGAKKLIGPDCAYHLYSGMK
jgi:hypothetical protein